MSDKSPKNLFLRQENPPCYGCEFRLAGCHAYCELYLEYSARCKEKRDQYLQEKNGKKPAIAHIADTSEKIRKRLGRSK